MTSPPEYDLALSFADEDRDLVERCAQFLQDVGYRVFYDRWEQHDAVRMAELVLGKI